MSSTPTELPWSTGSLKQYRVVCCAPFRHRPFPFSKTDSVGYNNLYELDLPENAGFDNLTAIAQDDCETRLLWHAQKYTQRTWRRKEWNFVCKIEGDHHRFFQIGDKMQVVMFLLERPIREYRWTKLREMSRKGELPSTWRYSHELKGVVSGSSEEIESPWESPELESDRLEIGESSGSNPTTPT